MDEFPSNSNKYREQPERVKKTEVDKQDPQEARRKIEKVVEGEVIRRKKPLGRRFKEFFFGGVDAQSVWQYIAEDIFVPAAKDLIYDAGSGGLERVLFHEERTHRRSRGRSRGRTDYQRYSRPYDDRPPFPPADRRRDRGREPDRRARSNHDFDDILLATRVEAETVIERLYDVLEQYGSVSVADLYEMVGITARFTDDKWGWYELPGASVRRTSAGYLIDIPRPVPLD